MTLVVLLILLFNISCKEQPVNAGNGKINVTVQIKSKKTDELGNRIGENILSKELDGIKIKLFENYKLKKTVLTTKGSYVFEGLEAGNYSVKAEINDIIFSEQTNLDVNEDSLSTYLIFNEVISNIDSINLINVYPNPYTMNFKLEFFLEQAIIPLISLINLKGDVVTDLTSQFINKPGHWELTGGEKVQAGVYFIQIKIGSNYAYSGIKRM